MTWINVNERLPSNEKKYYRCRALSFPHPIRCKFEKEKNGPFQWSSGAFIYNKRYPFVQFWEEI